MKSFGEWMNSMRESIVDTSGVNIGGTATSVVGNLMTRMNFANLVVPVTDDYDSCDNWIVAFSADVSKKGHLYRILLSKLIGDDLAEDWFAVTAYSIEDMDILSVKFLSELRGKIVRGEIR